MTREHCKVLAAELANENPGTAGGAQPLTQWYADCLAVAAVCERFNPAFDCEWFLRACGVNATTHEEER